MEHLAQWPVIVFIGMTVAFTITMLAVTVLDKTKA
ncbi:hypothetical protein HNP60_000357 [Sphingobium sp. B1D3A]|uniref:Uncharacterized protein n=1 Tax=Sphingobium lignivorans TaxID=2735886 RepID=A0ABR6NCZ1_9SPHN|nr:hypothetical protein [Sphingobium lignivorans]